MADTKSPANTDQIQAVALELFKSRSAMVAQRGTEMVAARCFADAAAFVEVAAKYRSGEIVPQPQEAWGADAFAPRLPKNHPINLVSREWGDKSRVNRLAKLLEANAANLDYELQDGDLSWSRATTNTARNLLPVYADKN